MLNGNGLIDLIASNAEMQETVTSYDVGDWLVDVSQWMESIGEFECDIRCCHGSGFSICYNKRNSNQDLLEFRINSVVGGTRLIIEAQYHSDGQYWTVGYFFSFSVSEPERSRIFESIKYQVIFNYVRSLYKRDGECGVIVSDE